MKTSRPVAASLAVAGYIIMIVPILFVVATAFTGGSTLRFPPEGFSLRWFAAALGYDPFVQALVSSLQLALIATVLTWALVVVVGRSDTWAGIVLVPYALWLSVATALSVAYARSA